MNFPSTLEGQMVHIIDRLGELERRARNRKRTGKIAEVDYAKGLTRVELSKQGGVPYLTDWVPWMEVASGGIKSHIPPTVGEQVDVVSENGDMTDAVVHMSTPSNANPRPHDGPEAVITMGGSRIFMSGGELILTTGSGHLN
jgi:phage baseplate assembly protein V